MTFKAKDADAIVREFAASGDGSALTPFVPTQAQTVADGADAAAGATTDPAAAAGAAGSVSAKLRRLSADLGSVLGYIDGLETLLGAGLPAALGQGLKAQGLRVTLPSDQDALPAPADPFGANADLAAVAGGAGSVSAKLRRLSADLGSVLGFVDGLETLLGAGLPLALTGSGALKVGNVDALPAGSARVGKVTVRNAADAADIDPLADTTFTGRLGEVAASPTAFTVLDRLKALATLLAAGLPAALGQGTMAQGLRVTLPSDQSAVPVSTGTSAAAALSDALANPTTTQIGAWLLAFDGAQGVRLRTQSKRVDLNAVAAGTIATAWSPAAGKRVRLMGGVLSVSAAGSLLFEDNAAGAFVFRTPKLAADSPYNFDLGQGVALGAVNNLLKMTLSVAGSVTGTLYGTEEP
jgi:hypothetical protein